MSFPSRKGWLIPRVLGAFTAPRVLVGIQNFVLVTKSHPDFSGIVGSCPQKKGASRQ